MPLTPEEEQELVSLQEEQELASLLAEKQQAKLMQTQKEAAVLPSTGEQGVSGTERAVVELLEKSPKLQEEYLQRKGYVTRRTADGQIEAAHIDQQSGKPTGTWGRVDPSGFDSGDVVSVLASTLEGAATAAGGILGFAVGGVPGAVVGSGGTAALMQAGKEAAAMGMGLQEYPDMGNVAEEAATGGLAGALGAGAATPAIRGTVGNAARGALRAVRRYAPAAAAGKWLYDQFRR